MKITGQHSFPMAREDVWTALLDPEVLSRTLPGCEDLEEVGENEFKGKLKMKVGPVQGVFQGGVKLTDLDPPNGYRLSIDGRGAPGFLNGTGSLSLSDEEGGTRLEYDIDAKVGGRIAAVGQRLLDSSAKVITKQALDGLEKQLAARAPAPSTSEAPSGGTASDDAVTTGAATAQAQPTAPAAEAPSQAAFAGEFAKGLLGELLPPERRGWVAAIGLLLLLAAVAIGLRGCG